MLQNRTQKIKTLELQPRHLNRAETKVEDKSSEAEAHNKGHSSKAISNNNLQCCSNCNQESTLRLERRCRTLQLLGARRRHQKITSQSKARKVEW